MRVDASNEDEAVAKMKDMMDADAIREHWQEMHRGDPPPSVQAVHRMIERELMPASTTA